MTYDKASFLAGLRTGLALPRIPKPRPRHYLTFKSHDGTEFALSIYDNAKHWNGTLYYSTDAEIWSVWDGTTALNSVNGVLHLRGSNNSYITGVYNTSANYRWVLTPGKQIKCIGNIEYLLDYETVKSGQHPPMSSGCYYAMFYNCTSLTASPDLLNPVATLSCYKFMFYGCTGLVSAPSELPAIRLYSDCYEYMFYGCRSLKTPPKLPATDLSYVESCYAYMFYGCESLETAPELPATSLYRWCYSYMFYGCSSLIVPPALPALYVPESGYSYMFYGCSSLAVPPALPATKIGNRCYLGMFVGCEALSALPELPALSLSDECYYIMFLGCRSIKIARTQSIDYPYEYRIPTSGTGQNGNNSLTAMFNGTGGEYIPTPSINTTYYTDHPPVPAE